MCEYVFETLRGTVAAFRLPQANTGAALPNPSSAAAAAAAAAAPEIQAAAVAALQPLALAAPSALLQRLHFGADVLTEALRFATGSGNAPLAADVLALLATVTAPGAAAADAASAIGGAGLAGCGQGSGEWPLPPQMLLVLLKAATEAFPAFEDGAGAAPGAPAGGSPSYRPSREAQASYQAACQLAVNILSACNNAEEGTTSRDARAQAQAQPPLQQQTTAIQSAALAAGERAARVLPRLSHQAPVAGNYMASACSVLAALWHDALSGVHQRYSQVRQRGLSLLISSTRGRVAHEIVSYGCMCPKA